MSLHLKFEKYANFLVIIKCSTFEVVNAKPVTSQCRRRSACCRRTNKLQNKLEYSDLTLNSISLQSSIRTSYAMGVHKKSSSVTSTSLDSLAITLCIAFEISLTFEYRIVSW